MAASLPQVYTSPISHRRTPRRAVGRHTMWLTQLGGSLLRRPTNPPSRWATFSATFSSRLAAMDGYRPVEIEDSHITSSQQSAPVSPIEPPGAALLSESGFLEPASVKRTIPEPTLPDPRLQAPASAELTTPEPTLSDPELPLPASKWKLLGSLPTLFLLQGW
ncbi:hypothetical protein EJ06DRAFT_170285 [Trichodelitschia bisporula]|uniref:Uncharacterized protein n=1 Tax=Trichodelitschia bisporula TaxID=703511 RepID=A0A6G1HLM2_9PEZI|nr:hypothetical protein EJ06DRAFT_170285 [Trichodelitschia bisporula]